MPRDAAPLGGGKTAAGETLAARRARLLAASRAAAATTARGAARKSLPASPAGPLPSATQASSTRPLAAAGLPHEAPELPHEALCLILASATSERALPTAAYFACVCTAWRRAARDEPRAWRRVDLTYGWCRPSDRLLARLLPRWGQLEELSLGGHKAGAITDASVSQLPDRCPRLRALSVGACVGVTAEALAALISTLPVLDDLSLGSVRLGPTGRATRHDNAAEMRALLPAVATGLPRRRLTRLALRGAALGAAECRLLLGTGAWPSLVELDLTEVRHAGTIFTCPTGQRLSLPWAALPRACPMLKRLLLGGVGGAVGLDLSAPADMDAVVEVDAWELTVLELQNVRTRWGSNVTVPKQSIPRMALDWFCRGALFLRRLDLTDRPEFGMDHLLAIVKLRPPLEELLIARTGAVIDKRGLSIPHVDGLNVFAREESSALAVVIAAFAPPTDDRWKAYFGPTYGSLRAAEFRLETLDVSGGAFGADDESLARLGEVPRLRALDASGTRVSDEGLRKAFASLRVARRLTAFKVLHLEGCRGLSRRVRIAAHRGSAAEVRKALAF